MWALVVAFAGYSLLLDLLAPRVFRTRPLVALAALTLPASAGLYALGAEPGGVFFLASDYAAASLTVRGTLLYVAAAVLCAAAIDPLLSRGATPWRTCACWQPAWSCWQPAWSCWPSSAPAWPS